MLKKPGPNHAFNQATSEDAEHDALVAEAQHRALQKMTQGTTPAPMGPPSVVTPHVLPAAPASPPPPPTITSIPKPFASAPAAPAMPGAAGKGRFFPGLTAALRKPKIGI